MAKRTRYSEYKDRYANYAFELDEDGVLFMQCHTNGDSSCGVGMRMTACPTHLPTSPATTGSRS